MAWLDVGMSVVRGADLQRPDMGHEVGQEMLRARPGDGGMWKMPWGWMGRGVAGVLGIWVGSYLDRSVIRWKGSGWGR